MNIHAIYHEPDSRFCFPTDEKTVEITLRTAAGEKIERVELVYGSKYDFYLKQNTALMKKKYTDDLYDWYFYRLSLEDVRLVYIFKLVTNEGEFFFSEEGLSKEYDYSKAYFSSFQYSYINKNDVMSAVPWLTNAVVYQIFPERFCRGDFEKDDSYINLKFGEKPTPKSFAGGDLKGIITKLDYIKSLGTTVIYLTPVFGSISNHKYDIFDYYNVDRQFGKNEDLKELISKAHSLGMRVLLDAVFNHASERLPQFQDVCEKGRESEYFDWFIVHGDSINKERDNYECFAACKYMPKLNTSCEALQNYLCGIATYWIKEYDADGWRLDVSDEVSHDFWRRFRKEVKAVKKDAAIIGENWHNSEQFLRGDQFDSIMNYSFTKACMDFFVDKSLNAESFSKRLVSLKMRNNSRVNSEMLNLLDCHDTHRFYTLLNKNLKSLHCALALLFMYEGASMIYYGTEVPMEGGYDPDCRRIMDFVNEKEETPTFKLIKALASLKMRKEFSEGDIDFKAEGNIFMLRRYAEEKEVCYAVNITKERSSLNCPGKLLINEGFKNGNLEGESFVIWEVNR